MSSPLQQALLISAAAVAARGGWAACGWLLHNRFNQLAVLFQEGDAE